jgi:hypothetical protein
MSASLHPVISDPDRNPVKLRIPYSEICVRNMGPEDAEVERISMIDGDS